MTTNNIPTVLAVVAAAMICFSAITTLNDPSRLPVLRQPSLSAPDSFNARLDDLQGILAPIDSVLPPNAALRYLSESEERKQFEFTQAVVAPRRLGRDIESPYLLVIAESEQWLSRQQELKGARMLHRLPWGITLYVKGQQK